VLLLGLGSAGSLYWFRTRDAESANPLLEQYQEAQSRAASRQTGLLFGRSGQVLQKWADDLKEPDTQAELIAIASTLFALGCFYLARRADDHAADRT